MNFYTITKSLKNRVKMAEDHKNKIFFHKLIELSWLLPITISVLAGFVLYNLTPVKVTGYGGLDPFIYLGYSVNFEELINFYGTTYYSTRIAHILPQSLFYRLFGITTGYILFKSLCLGAAVFFTYKTLRLFKSVYTSLIVTTLAIFSPIPIASILWDHYDGTVYIYQIATLFVALKARSENYENKFSLILVGVFLALVLNGNIWAAAITILILTIFFLELLLTKQGIWRALRVLCFTAIGLISFALLLVATFNCLGYDCELKSLDIFGLGISRWVLSGGGATWYGQDTLIELFSGTFGYSYILYGVPISLTVILLTFRKNLHQPSIKYLISLSFIVQIGAALFVDQIFKTAVLKLNYYVIYLYPCLILLIGVNIPNKLSKLQTAVLIISATLVFIAYWSDYGRLLFDQFQILEPQIFSSVSLWSGYFIGLLFFVVILYAINFGDLEADYHKFALIVILIFLLGSINLNANKNPLFSVFNQNQTGVNERVFEHREASKKLIEIVNNTVKKGESFKFQYNNSCDSINFYKNKPCFSTIQSVYLWGYSMVVLPNEFQNYMFSAKQLDKLDGIDKLFVLGSDDEIAKTIKSLKKLNIDPKLTLKSNFEGNFLSFSITVLELS